jgi:hypothetical protein
MNRLRRGTLAAAAFLAACGGYSEDQIEIRGRRYVVLNEAKTTVRMIEEIVKSRAGGLECGGTQAECVREFNGNFDAYIRYVDLDPAGNGMLTYSLKELGPEHFRGNAAVALNQGCGVVRVEIRGFRIASLRCSPEP